MRTHHKLLSAVSLMTIMIVLGITLMLTANSNPRDLSNLFLVGFFLFIWGIPIGTILTAIYGQKYQHEKVIAYLPRCPICGSKRITEGYHFTPIEPQGNFKETLTCVNCEAKWHIYIGLTSLKWARLEVEAEDGRGRDLLGKKLQAAEWRKMATERVAP